MRCPTCYLTVVCLSVCPVCPVCYVGVCGQTVGWINATWYGGRPRPRPHCVRWGPSSSQVAQQSSHTFRLTLLWHGSPSQQQPTRFITGPAISRTSTLAYSRCPCNSEVYYVGHEINMLQHCSLHLRMHIVK